MNYGQPGAPETTLDTLVRVTTKHDGSLGIGWKYDGQYGIATRGSFASDQAVHATAKIDDGIRAQIDEAELDYTTPIYEIVHPGNRIVLDYGSTDKLFELGEVRLSEGTIQYRPSEIYHPVHSEAGIGDYISLQLALNLPIPSDEEGYVLDIYEYVRKFSGGRYEVTGHVKLKGEEYKILHGLLTNTNARRIWVQLAARACHEYIDVPEQWAHKLGNDPADFARVDVTKSIEETLLTNVPDEFYDWVTKQIDSMTDRVSDLVAQAQFLALQVRGISDKRSRYEWVKDHELCKEILALASSIDNDAEDDLGPIVTKAWKLVKPAGNDTPFSQEED